MDLPISDYESYEEGDEQEPKAIFILDDAPIPIHLHGSLSSGARQALANKIKEAGGDPTASESEARVIICRTDLPVFKKLQFIHDHDRFRFVEGPSWVDSCIKAGRYRHNYHGKEYAKKKNSNKRVPFTPEDDELIVEFLAYRIPYKEMGGRSGQGLWKDLCDPRRAARYPWADRHPWQSWRERYVKNQDIFDGRISRAVKLDPDAPEPGEKGQYILPSKRPREKAKRVKETIRYSVHADPTENQEEEEEGEDEEEDEIDELESEEEDSIDEPAKKRLRKAKAVRRRPSPVRESVSSTGDKSVQAEPGREVDLGWESSDTGLFQAPQPPPLASPRVPPQVGPSRVLRGAHTASKSEPVNTQRTLVEPTQDKYYNTAASPDTQATVIGSPPLIQQPATLPIQPVARNTRSRSREPEQVQPRPVPTKVQNARKKPHIPGNNHALPPVPAQLHPKEEEGQGSVSALREADTAIHEEGLVKREILPVQNNTPKRLGNDDDSSDSEESGDDDEAARILRNTTQELVNKERANLATPKPPERQLRPRSKRLALLATPTKPTKPPVIDMLSHSKTVAARDSRVLHASFMNTRSTPDDTTPRPRSHTARKTAILNPPPATYSTDTDHPQSDAPTESSESSYPAEDTDAKLYKIAQAPFSPLHNTRAKSVVESVKTTKKKGKGKARAH